MTTIWLIVLILILLFAVAAWIHYAEDKSWLKTNFFIPKKFKLPAVPFRDPTEQEKTVLQTHFSEASAYKEHKKTIIYGSIVLDVVLFAFIIWLVATRKTSSAEFAILGLLPILVFAMLYQAGVLIKAGQAKFYQHDLQSKIFKVSGHLSTYSHTQKNIGTSYEFVVSGYSFTADEQLFKSFNFDDFVSIEFSPNTRTLWKIYQSEIPAELA